MYRYIEQDGEIIAVDDPIAHQEILKKRYKILLKQSKIPDFYHNIEFEDYQGDKESDTFKRILEYANNCHLAKFNFVSLFIHGNTNTQKTAIACNILKQAMRNGLKTKFILAGLLIDKLMKLQGFNSNPRLLDEIESLRTCDILLIDDAFDPEKSLYWPKAESNNLILAEWDSFLRDVLSKKIKLIITSNYNIENIGKIYGIYIRELIDRNFVEVQLVDSIKDKRKELLQSSFFNESEVRKRKNE